MIIKTIKKLWLRQRPANEKGAVAVEFALVLGIFLIFFLGIIEYGWIMTQQIVLSHAVSEGARAAVKMPEETSDSDLASEARDIAIEAFSPVGTLLNSDFSVVILEPQVEPPLPRRIFVGVPSWTYTPLVGYLPNLAVPDSLSTTSIFVFP